MKNEKQTVINSPILLNLKRDAIRFQLHHKSQKEQQVIAALSIII